MSRLARRLLDALAARADGRGYRLALALVAMALCLPALAIGLHYDDAFLLWAARGYPGAPQLAQPWFHLFRFSDGEPARVARMIEHGILPWWSYASLKIAGFRPLAALTHLLDEAAWPGSPALMHLHSVLWLGALVAAGAALFRRVLPSAPVAALAGLLFALEDGHGFAAGWIAQRNALMAATFAALALAAHDGWRRRGGAARALGAAALLALALASSEGAIAALAYLSAYALFLEDGPLARRAASLLPAAAVAAVWFVAYKASGSGGVGCDFYVDPLRQPVAFLEAFALRAPALLAGQFTPLPVEFQLFLPEEWIPLHTVVSLGVIAPLIAVAVPLLRAERVARFLAVGMLGALVPACASPSMDRVLVYVGLGGAGLVALLVARLASSAAGAPERSALWILVASNVVISPLLLPLRAISPAIRILPVGVGAETAPSDPAVASQDLIVVRAPDPYAAGLIPIDRALRGGTAPRSVRLLAATLGPLEVYREDERTLVLERPGGIPWQEIVWVRDDDTPLRVGDRFALPGLSAEVLRVSEKGHLIAARVALAARLEDPRFRWVVWHRGAFVPFDLPSVGQTVALPAPTLAR